MCNLYKMTKTVEEVARLFGAVADPPGNAGDTVYPGYPGIVVAPDGGTLRVRQMVWGFPLTLKGKNGQPLKPKPVNNCRTDKLAGGFWRPSFHARRCLIPVTAFCEAESGAISGLVLFARTDGRVITRVGLFELLLALEVPTAAGTQATVRPPGVASLDNALGKPCLV